MKKVHIAVIFYLTIFNINGNDDYEVMTVEETRTEMTEELYIDDTLVSANRIHYLYPDYPATPGDVYDIIYLLPSMDESNTIAGFVDHNYIIDLSFIGKVNVKGLKYVEIRDVLKKAMQRAYPGSIVNVVIKSTGLFKVTLLGEVKRSYILDAMSLTTLEQIIFEKTTKYADLRNIEIKSEDGSLNIYDLYMYQRYAQQKHNPFLRPNDVITLKPFERKITLSGEVRRPGDYILKESDTLTTVLELYGDGFTKDSDITRIIIERKGNTDKLVDLSNNNPDLIELQDMDIITVPKEVIHTNEVTLKGAVYTPGIYELNTGGTLHDLIEIYGHGGTKLADYSSIEILRIISEDDEYNEETLYIDTQKNNPKEIVLFDRDIVNIKSLNEVKNYVTFQGAISPLDDKDSEDNTSNRIESSFIKGSKLSTVLKSLEGEFTLSSDLQNAYILRGTEKIFIDIKNILSEKESKFDLVLENKDIIIIPFRQLKVFVGGSVNSEGSVPFVENRTAAYYIGLAGGYDRVENLFGSYFIRDVYGNKVDKNAIISPEDVIWVNRDHPMSYIEEYAGWITTVISTIILTYQLANN